jgi:hypothetical protein
MSEELDAPKEFEKYKVHLDIGSELRGMDLSIAYYIKKQELIRIEQELLKLALMGAEAAKKKLGDD